MRDKDNRFFDDASTLLSGGLELAHNMSDEVSAFVKVQIEKKIADFNLVSSEEHQIALAMIEKIRAENQVL